MTTRSSERPESLADPRNSMVPGSVVITLLTLSAFGPYIHPALGLRTEQLVVYVTCVAAMAFRLSKIQLSAVFPVLVPWSLLFLVAFVGNIGIPPPAPFLGGSALAGIDNLLLPVAVIVVVSSVVLARDAERLLRIAGRVIVVAATANAVLALVSTRIDLTEMLRPFWAQAGPEKTTSEFAAELGRFGGVFNQPAEAGVVYGLAALLAVYLYAHRPWLVAVLLTVISLGGILCVSKVFIFGGLPLTMFFLVRQAVISGRIGVLLATPMVVAIAPQAFGLNNWMGLDFLVRLLRPTEATSLVDLYSAGRFSSGSRLEFVMSQALDVSPIFGVGAAGWRVAYDSAWGEAVVVAGLIGVLALITAYLAVVWMAFSMRPGPTRDLAKLVAVFLVGASFGIPSLTANRAATLVWLIVTLLFLVRSAERSRGEDSTTTTVRRERTLKTARG